MSSFEDAYLDPGGPGPEVANGVSDSYLEAKCPILWRLLTETNFRGTPRTTHTLLFFYDEGKLKCCLNDRQRAAVAFVTLDSAEGAFEDLEELLRSGKLVWRNSRNRR